VPPTGTQLRSPVREGSYLHRETSMDEAGAAEQPERQTSTSPRLQNSISPQLQKTVPVRWQS
jgi:hypothetical protein